MATVNDPSQNFLYRLGQNIRSYAPETKALIGPPLFNPWALRNIWSSARTIGTKGFGPGNPIDRAVQNFNKWGTESGTRLAESAVRGVAGLKAGLENEPLPDWATPPTAATATRPNVFVPKEGTAAARANDISESARGRVTGITPNAKLNIETPLGKYAGVSPEFARTAGAITPELAKNIATTINPLRNQAAQKEQEEITQNAIKQNKIYQNNILAARSVPSQMQPAGLTNEDKMERYGTLFPDQLPQNPTWRDVRNFQDYNVRSRLVPTSNPGVGAGSGAAAGAQSNF